MKLSELVKLSTYTGKEKPSSSRILSYVMMGQILLTGLTYVGIEITNAVISFKAGGAYIIPPTHVTIFGMMLSHQLMLLGIYKYSEKKDKKDLADIPTEES